MIYRFEEIAIGWVHNFVKNITGKRLLLVLPSLWVLLFFIFPCFILLKISLAEGIVASPPYSDLIDWVSDWILQIRLNLGNYLMLFTNEMYLRGFVTSLIIAAASTLCCLVVGFPMALAIARSSEKVRNILLMLIVLPFWTSFLIRVYAWIMLLSPSGLINNILMKYQLIEVPLPLINNSYAACLGIIYAYLPFMIFPLYNAVEKIDYSIIEAAYDLGSTPPKTFFSIVVPLTTPGIYAGSILVFVPAIGEFVIPELLGGAQTLTIGRLVWNEFFWNLSWPTAAALSILLLTAIVFPVMMSQRRKEIRFLMKDNQNAS
ncbi:MAG: ABC transporter permease subunit [Holosporaceae bacterium]|jgi:putrescine transport system permease protein|nr:ABC transporter permease subunit [Holosporaceae bacterium]